MGGDIRKPWVCGLLKGSSRHNCKTYVVTSKHIIVIFPSYVTLLTLNYRDRVEKSCEACCKVEEEGLSIREAKRIIEAELFLDEYP